MEVWNQNSRVSVLKAEGEIDIRTQPDEWHL